MQVQRNSFTENVYEYYKQNQAGKDTRSVTWLGLLSQAREGLRNQEAENPSRQVLRDYEEWKSHQPPRELPGTQGATRENEAYLREHFSGRLSLFERLDAADTMVEMGILTREQMLDSLGLGELTLRSVSLEGPWIVSTGPVGHDARFDAWTDFFYAAPIMQAETLDLLLKELEGGMKFFGKKYDAAEEIRAVLSQLTRRAAA